MYSKTAAAAGPPALAWARSGMPVGAGNASQGGPGVERRTGDGEVAEHCRREEVECGSALEQQACDIAAAHVAGAAERGFEVSASPVPRGFDQSGLLVEQLAGDWRSACAARTKPWTWSPASGCGLGRDRRLL